MSHLRAPAARADRREGGGGRHGRPVARTAPPLPETHLRPQLLRLAVLPPVAVALSACAAVLFTVRSTGARQSLTLWAVLAGALTVTLVGILIASVAADRAARSVNDRIGALRRSSARGEADLRAVVEALRRGESAPQRKPRGGPPEDADDFELLAADLARAHDGAVTAVVQAAQLSSQTGSEQKLEVFVNLARRLQSLVHREISILDELENEIEDPDLLKGLFHVDHLATRIRRHAENLAVLGGAVSRRQWSNPVSMTEVLRSAIAEVEQYSRVKLVPPIDGELRGHAVADVIHLLAELVENATVFSAPHTQVLLRANLVTSGLAVEVEDRGLGMPVEEQSRMNALLTDPDQVNVARLLADGRIGLFVVSQLARRHGIRVRLQTNIYGGVQAVLVVPQGLLGTMPGVSGAVPQLQDPAGGARGPAAPQPGAAAPEAGRHLPPPAPSGVRHRRQRDDDRDPAFPAHSGGPVAMPGGGGGPAPMTNSGGPASSAGVGGPVPVSGGHGSVPVSDIGGWVPASGIGGSVPVSGGGGSASSAGVGGPVPMPDGRGSVPVSGTGGPVPVSGGVGSAGAAGVGGPIPMPGSAGSASMANSAGPPVTSSGSGHGPGFMPSGSGPALTPNGGGVVPMPRGDGMASTAPTANGAGAASLPNSTEAASLPNSAGPPSLPNSTEPASLPNGAGPPSLPNSSGPASLQNTAGSASLGRPSDGGPGSLSAPNADGSRSMSTPNAGPGAQSHAGGPGPLPNAGGLDSLSDDGTYPALPTPNTALAPAPQPNGVTPAPLPVRGPRGERPNPASAVPGIRPDERRTVAENTVGLPVPRNGAVRGTMGKPQLPRRRAQEHIAPQLRGGPAPRPAAEDVVGHDPGLMAAFQRGVGLAEAQQSLESAPPADASLTGLPLVPMLPPTDVPVPPPFLDTSPITEARPAHAPAHPEAHGERDSRPAPGPGPDHHTARHDGSASAG
ncbi:ATP-binding protein [Streptomyces sp. NPDC002928]|uniref:ATP-binding protein n=1 Tax=Streptomyces sp. NPDC002928 TaxID=3154440 RepID=UPI0033A843AF